VVEETEVTAWPSIDVIKLDKSSRDAGSSLGRPRAASDDQRRLKTMAKPQAFGVPWHHFAGRRSGRSIPHD
jgi:hypothetical protein